MLVAPLAIWLAIDAHADSRTRRWCFRAIALWLLATVIWDISTYRDWEGLDDESDAVTSVIDLLLIHAGVYGVIAIGWFAASFFVNTRPRLYAGLLAVPTLVASPVIANMGDIVQVRTTWVVPFGTLLLVPAAALFVIAMSKATARETSGYLPGVTASDTAVAAVIAGMAGLLGVLFREQILAVYRAEGWLPISVFDDTTLIAATAVGLIFACAVGWLIGVRERSGRSPRPIAKVSVGVAPILGVVSFFFAALLGG